MKRQSLCPEAAGFPQGQSLIMLGSLLLASAVVSAQAQTADFQRWCGKYYQYGAPMDETSIPYAFPYPEKSNVPLLDFRCTPRSSYYLEGDAEYDPPSMIIDTDITYDVGEACKLQFFNVQPPSLILINRSPVSEQSDNKRLIEWPNPRERLCHGRDYGNATTNESRWHQCANVNLQSHVHRYLREPDILCL